MAMRNSAVFSRTEKVLVVKPPLPHAHPDQGLPVAQMRRALKKFPNIADPGADRILLFGGMSPVAAVPSNNPHVLVRIQSGPEGKNYGETYRKAQQMIAEGVPATFDVRMRAYLLLKQHGQQSCKRTKPKCHACPVARHCKQAAMVSLRFVGS